MIWIENYILKRRFIVKCCLFFFKKKRDENQHFYFSLQEVRLYNFKLTLWIVWHFFPIKQLYSNEFTTFVEQNLSLIHLNQDFLKITFPYSRLNPFPNFFFFWIELNLLKIMTTIVTLVTLKNTTSVSMTFSQCETFST